MSSDETTPSMQAPSKRRWIIKVAAAALSIGVIAFWMVAGVHRPQQYVGRWTVASTGSNAAERQFEFLADGTFWTYSAGAKTYEGTWYGSERELVVVTDVTTKRPSVGRLRERLVRFALNPSGSRHTIKFDVASSGKLLTLTLTDEFGAQPQKPQEITIRRVVE
jgi:hypothetical protein